MLDKYLNPSQIRLIVRTWGTLWKLEGVSRWLEAVHLPDGSTEWRRVSAYVVRAAVLRAIESAAGRAIPAGYQVAVYRELAEYFKDPARLEYITSPLPAVSPPAQPPEPPPAP